MARALKSGSNIKSKCIEIAESIGLLMQGDDTFDDVTSDSYWDIALTASDEVGVGIPVTITEWMNAVRRGHSLRLDSDFGTSRTVEKSTEVKGGEIVE